MFKILSIKDKVRVPPIRFDMELDKAIKESLQDQVEGKLNPDLGVFLAVTDVTNIGDGYIVPEDGAVHYPVEYKTLVYRPELNELVLGEVVDITEFGAFTRIGPIDALVHVSQVMDDKIAYDAKNAIFTGKKTGNKLREGDVIKARIVGVSLGKGRSKISLTMRQPGLGSTDWLEKSKKISKREDKKK